MTTGFSEPGYPYQLILRGDCGPLTAWLSGDVVIESGDGCTSIISKSGTIANSTACPTGSRTSRSTWSASTRSAVRSRRRDRALSCPRPLPRTRPGQDGKRTMP